MIRSRLAAILTAQGRTPYWLAKAAGMTVPGAYQIAHQEEMHFRAETLDRICAALNVQPGDVLEYVPTPAPRSSGPGSRGGRQAVRRATSPTKAPRR